MGAKKCKDKKRTKNGTGISLYNESPPTHSFTADMSAARQDRSGLQNIQGNQGSCTADVLRQSREVLYEQQNMQQTFLSTQSMGNNANLCNQMPVQNTSPSNVHVTCSSNQQYTGGQYNRQDVTNGTTNIPLWAENICHQLQNIQFQLETQNQRWQSVESKLTHQSERMTNMESQIAQFSQLKQTVSENTRIIGSVNTEVRSLKSKIDEYEDNVNYYSEICDSVISANTDLCSKLSDLTARVSIVEDKVVDSQWRNMRENLIFTGIPETELTFDELGRPKREDCESIIKHFLRTEMQISRDIELDRVHRLGKFKRGQTYSRPIIAKFTFYKDKEMVRQLAPETLMGKRYGVREQFPEEFEAKRKLLYPVAKSARQNRENKVRLVRDKLFINGRQHTPDQTETQLKARPVQTNVHTNERYQQRHQPPRRQSATYIGQKFNQQNQVSTGSRADTQQFTNCRPDTNTQQSKQYENRSNWVFPSGRHEDHQIRTPVNTHSQSDNHVFTSNKFILLSNDNMMDTPSQLAGKQKAKSPLDADLTLKKQKPHVSSECENSMDEMDIQLAADSNVFHECVSSPVSNEYTRL